MGKNTLHTVNAHLTRATQPLRAPPMPYKALKLSSEVSECKPLPESDAVAVVRGNAARGAAWDESRIWFEGHRVEALREWTACIGHR